MLRASLTGSAVKRSSAVLSPKRSRYLSPTSAGRCERFSTWCSAADAPSVNHSMGAVVFFLPRLRVKLAPSCAAPDTDVKVRICASERASPAAPTCVASAQSRPLSSTCASVPASVPVSASAPASVSAPASAPASLPVPASVPMSLPAPASVSEPASAPGSEPASVPAPPSVSGSPSPSCSDKSNVVIGSSMPKRFRMGTASVKAACAYGVYFSIDAGVTSPKSMVGMRISKNFASPSPFSSSPSSMK